MHLLNKTQKTRKLIANLILMIYVILHFIIWNVGYLPLLLIQSEIFHVMNWLLFGSFVLNLDGIFVKGFLRKSIFFIVIILVLTFSSYFVGYGARARSYIFSLIPIFWLIVLMSSFMSIKMIKLMFTTLLGLFMVYHILGIVGFIFRFESFFGIIPNTLIDNFRYSSILTNPNAWGEFTFVSLMIALWFFLNEKNTKTKVLYIPLFLIIGAALLISLSRNALLLTLITYILLMVYSKHLERWLKQLLFTGASLVVLAFLVLLIFKTDFALDFFRLNQGLTGRNELWAFIIEQIKLNPWFGVGYNNSSIMLTWNTSFDVSSSHSMYLGLLYEMGIIGFSILILWIIKRGSAYIHRSKLDTSYRLSMILFTILWISFFIGQIFEIQFFKIGAINTFMFAMIGISYTLEHSIKSEMSPKQVVHIITGLESGGAESMLYKLTSYRDASKYQYTVISLTGEGIYGSRMRELGIHVISLHMGKKGMFKGLYQAQKILRDAFVVQGWLYHGNLVALILTMFYDVRKLIWGIRQTDISYEHNKKSTMHLARVLSYVSFIPDVILSNSMTGIESHVDVGYNKKKFKQIKNGFEVSNYALNEKMNQELRKAYHLENTLILGHVARFDAQKDQDTLFKALKIVKSKFNKPWKLVCLGIGMTEDNQDLIAMLKENELLDDVILLGVKQNISDFMSLFDLFVLSSLGEGFPNVIGEAMSAETPCVATNVGECKEIIGDTGLVVEPKNPLILADALLKLMLLSHKERLDLGILARRRILETYDMMKVVKDYESYYEE